jgi:hypothetical protein
MLLGLNPAFLQILYVHGDRSSPCREELAGHFVFTDCIDYLAAGVEEGSNGDDLGCG